MIHWIKNEIKQFQVLLKNLGFLCGVKYRLATKLKVESVNVKVHGQKIRVRTRTHDLKVALESLGAEYSELATYVSADFSGVIIDAGGYIGSAALQFGRMFPKATVVSIEASSKNFALLSRNVEGYDNIITLHRALSKNSKDEVSLKDRGTGEWGFTVLSLGPSDSATDKGSLEKVTTISISDIKEMFPGKNIGVIKLDIEGAEKELFESDDADLKSIPVVVVELHDKIIPGCKVAFEAFSKRRKILKLDGEKYISLDLIAS